MFDPLSIVAPYDENQFINNCLQAYNTCSWNDEQLDLIREIQQSGNYYYEGLVIPGVANRLVGPLATVNGSAVIPPGTYVTSINCYASMWEQQANVGGFKFKIYDKGSKASIFYGEYGIDRVVSSPMSLGTIYDPVPTDQGMNADIPFGPGYLMEPFIISGPGVIGWEVSNLSGASNLIQLLLNCAVPVNLRSIGNMIVSKG
jgi:hypothetical protein